MQSNEVIITSVTNLLFELSLELMLCLAKLNNVNFFRSTDAVLECFFRLALEDFTIGRVLEADLHPDYCNPRVAVYVLVRKTETRFACLVAHELSPCHSREHLDWVQVYEVLEKNAIIWKHDNRVYFNVWVGVCLSCSRGTCLLNPLKWIGLWRHIFVKGG